MRALPPAEVPDLLAELADPDRYIPDTRVTALICARAVPCDPAHGDRLTDLLVAGLTDPHKAVRAQALPSGPGPTKPCGGPPWKGSWTRHTPIRTPTVRSWGRSRRRCSTGTYGEAKAYAPTRDARARQGERDHRDALRRIAALTGCLERTARQGLVADCRPLWRDTIALIAEHDASLRWAVTARTELWDPDAPPAERARELRAQARAVRDRPLLAARTAVTMARRSRRVSPAALTEARDAALAVPASGARWFARRRNGSLPPRDGLFVGLYAVALAENHASRATSTGGELGPELRVLRDLLAHPVPEVRDAACAALSTWERN